ncbi:MAG: squalene synthase HpnC [Methylibium sp.]|nr:squalene synthase HpnC [Methylibium sp.]
MNSQHYENFPVASVLCPPSLRPAIAAIYGYARTADDLADEGEATPAQRLADLAAFRADLHDVARGLSPSPRWQAVFMPLATAISAHRLPIPLLEDLLSAFEQDVHLARYTDRFELLDYCRRSANPVGRLLLHLYGIRDVKALRQSDAICSALQLINFWQDLSVDLPRGRLYIPLDQCSAYGLSEFELITRRDSAAARDLVRAQCEWARRLMAEGAPLVHQVGGRAGWELRGVVQGGLRVLDKIAAVRFDTLQQRPKLGRRDWLPIAWNALVMRP